MSYFLINPFKWKKYCTLGVQYCLNSYNLSGSRIPNGIISFIQTGLNALCNSADMGYI